MSPWLIRHTIQSNNTTTPTTYSYTSIHTQLSSAQLSSYITQMQMNSTPYRVLLAELIHQVRHSGRDSKDNGGIPLPVLGCGPPASVGGPHVLGVWELSSSSHVERWRDHKGKWATSPLPLLFSPPSLTHSLTRFFLCTTNQQTQPTSNYLVN